MHDALCVVTLFILKHIHLLYQSGSRFTICQSDQRLTSVSISVKIIAMSDSNRIHREDINKSVNRINHFNDLFYQGD